MTVSVRNKHFLKAGVAVSALGMALATQPVLAQDTSSDDSSFVLEEIVVSATRRQTSLQETPVAVTALTERQTDSLIPRDLGDIAALVPNFSASKVTGFNAASFAIRGAAQTDIIVYSEAQVAVTLDDFVVPHVQTQLLDIFDIEQIEVLRGPQGTLFGKNATAGVVSVRTKRPDLEEFSTEGRLQYGSFNRFEGRLAINAPISDAFGIRVSAQYQNSDGFYRAGADFGPVTPFVPNNVSGATGSGRGNRLGGEDVFSMRAKALFKPTDDLEMLFQYEMIRDRSDTVPAVNETPVGDPRFVFNLLGFNQDPGDPLDNAGVTTDAAIGADIGADDGHLVNVDGYYANIEWAANDNVTIKSITGYREQYSQLWNDYVGEGGPTSLFDATRADERETFQQEIRANVVLNDRADLVVGGFFQSNDVTFCVTQTLGFLDLFGLGTPDGFFNTNPQVLCNAQDAEALAFYADATYEVTDKLTIAGGIRYTWEDKNWIGRNQVNYQALGGGFDPSLSFQSLGALGAADFDRFNTGVLADNDNGEFDEPSWRLNVSYQFEEDIYGYANVARSFRSGAFNDQSGTTGNELTPALIAPTRPEIVTSYEAGLRTEFLDGAIRFNPTIFYADYTDAQRQIAATLTNSQGVDFQETRFFNAADASIFGVELEMQWVTDVPGLVFGGNASYQDAEFNTFEADTDFDGTIDVDFSDRPLTRTPEFMWTLYAQYERPVGDDLLFRFNTTAAYEDDNVFSYSDVDPEFDTFLNSRTLVNVMASIGAEDDSWYFRVFGRNILDERYRVSSQAVANLWVFSQYGEPFAWGMELGFRF